MADADEGRGTTGAAGSRGQLGTVRNAGLLLCLLAEGPAFHQLTELAEHSGLTLPTVHRLLRSLVAAGLVEQDEASARYSLGPELVRLSERYLARLPVLTALSPYLVELRNTTKATILVALLVRDAVVYVERVDGEDVSGPFRESHRVRAATGTAAGRVLLAHADGQALADAGADAAAARRWASEPYLQDRGDELHEPVEVAVAVHAADGRVSAALVATAGVATFTDEVTRREVVPHLQRAAAAAARMLDGR